MYVYIHDMCVYIYIYIERYRLCTVYTMSMRIRGLGS